MCGIAGFCNRVDKWEECIRMMNYAIKHRGPDGEGIWREENGQVVLGHRRLSIIDLSEMGSQPMVSESERYVLSYNGEIYNYKAIMKRMETEGIYLRLRGTSDTEVLLKAFEEWGITKTLNECKGMFAIALFDRNEKCLYLIRDRVGEKPLFYGLVGNSFTFASDLNSIEILPDFKKEINKDVLKTYFSHGYIPAPFSIYKGIYKLEPGCILKIRWPFSEWEIDSYWSMEETAKSGEKRMFQGSEEDACDELERLLKSAIEEQMVADVPIGAFLSGGIDSSTIVSMMQSISCGKVKTYTIGMNDRNFDEAKAAKKIAEVLGTNHTELYISEKDMKGVIPKLPDIFAEPFADSSQIPTYLVSQLAHRNVKVVFSGDGGDELFGGYNTYAWVRNTWESKQRISYWIQNIRGKIYTSSFMKDEKDKNWLKGKLLSAKSAEELYLNNIEEKVCRTISNFDSTVSHSGRKYKAGYLKGIESNIMLMDLLMYHPDDILTKVDRCAMANSLETRIPLLDKEIVSFAWSLPMQYKIDGSITKKILRKILYRYVPQSLMERPKRGFSVPLKKWFQEGELREWAENLLEHKKISELGLLNSKAVRQIWKDYIENGIWTEYIWYLLVFQQWSAKAGI